MHVPQDETGDGQSAPTLSAAPNRPLATWPKMIASTPPINGHKNHDKIPNTKDATADPLVFGP